MHAYIQSYDIITDEYLFNHTASPDHYQSIVYSISTFYFCASTYTDIDLLEMLRSTYNVCLLKYMYNVPL